MKYINEIFEGEQIVEHYLCKTRQSYKSKNDKTYLSLKLADKTGMVDAKVWNLGNDIQSFAENDMIKIDGVAQRYNNEIQINIKRIRKSLEGEYEPADYIPSTEKNIDEMWNEFAGYIDKIQNQYVKELLSNIFLEDEFVTKTFKSHSAAKSIHHGYWGGLLEHSLSVTQICEFMSGKYNYVDKDVLVASAMLHDVGKLWELSDFPVNDYTDEGQLLGHIYMGAELVEKTAGTINGFPEKLKLIIKHCILAHHGEFEFGSPVLPKTLEAYILHCADDMDAKSKVFEEFIEADSTSGPWAGYQKMLSRNIRKTEY